MGVPDRRTSPVNVGCFTGCSEPHQEWPASPGQTSSSKGVAKQNCRLYRGSPHPSTPQENLLLFSVSSHTGFLWWRTLTHKAGFAWIIKVVAVMQQRGGHSSWTSASSALTPPHKDVTVVAPSFAPDQRQKMFPSYYARGFVCRSNTSKSRTSNAVSTCWGTLVLKPRRAATYLEGDGKPFLGTWALQIWFPQLIKPKQKGTWLSKEESHSTFPMTDQTSSVSVGGAETKQVM